MLLALLSVKSLFPTNAQALPMSGMKRKPLYDLLAEMCWRAKAMVLSARVQHSFCNSLSPSESSEVENQYLMEVLEVSKWWRRGDIVRKAWDIAHENRGFVFFLCFHLHDDRVEMISFFGVQGKPRKCYLVFVEQGLNAQICVCSASLMCATWCVKNKSRTCDFVRRAIITVQLGVKGKPGVCDLVCVGQDSVV